MNTTVRVRVLLLTALVLAVVLAVVIALRSTGSAGAEPGVAATSSEQKTASPSVDRTATGGTGSTPARPPSEKPAENSADTGHRRGSDGSAGRVGPPGPDESTSRGEPAPRDEPAHPGGASGGKEPAESDQADGELAAVAARPGPPSVAAEAAGDGLVGAAAEDPGDRVPGQARRGAAPDRMGGLPTRAAITPEQVHGEVGQAPGGCLPEYGKDGQCLPAVPPSMAAHVAEMERAGIDPASMDHHWSCRELRTFFPDGIPVRVEGVDPQELDGNGDALACGPGD